MISRFLRDAGFNVVAQATSLTFGVASSVVLARVLGPENRGVVAVALLLPATVHAVVCSGFSAAVIHSIASSRWANGMIVPRALGISAYLAISMLVVGLATLYFHERIFPGVPLSLLCYGFVLAPLSLLQNGLQGVMVGKRAFHYAMRLRFAVAPLRLLLVVVWVWWFDFGAVGAVWAQLLGMLAEVCLSIFWVEKLIGADNLYRWPSMRLSVLKDTLVFGARAHVGNLAGFLNYRVDQFLVNGMLGGAGVASYAIAVGNAEKLWMVVRNFAAVVFPAAAAPSDDPARFARFIARLAAMVLLLLIVSGAVVGAFAETLVRLLYGRDYAPVAEAIHWLLPGIVLLGHTKIMTNYIAGRGRPGIPAAGSSMALVLNVIANIILIPMYGIKGAALATSISYTAQSIYVYVNFVLIAEVGWRQPLIPSGRDVAALWGVRTRLWAKRESRSG